MLMVARNDAGRAIVLLLRERTRDFMRTCPERHQCGLIRDGSGRSGCAKGYTCNKDILEDALLTVLVHFVASAEHQCNYLG